MPDDPPSRFRLSAKTTPSGYTPSELRVPRIARPKCPGDDAQVGEFALSDLSAEIADSDSTNCRKKHLRCKCG